MNSYYKNTILCGAIDYYCLLCEEAFTFPEQIQRHIRWEQHRKKRKELSYNTKYKSHHIYKIGNYYYCELCNYATKTLMDKHIEDIEHLLRLSNPNESKKISLSNNKATRHTSGLLIYDDRIISEFQWHGIANNHCSLCNVAVQNMCHIEEVDHMVSLVQDKMATRIFMLPTKSKSHAEKDSKDKDDLANKILTYADVENEVIYSMLTKEKICFFIKLKESKARCFRCKEEILDITINSLTAHRRAHSIENDESDLSDVPSEYVKVVDHGNHRSSIRKYGKRNHIKLNEGGSKVYCNLCDVYITPHLNMVKQHVRGLRHRGMSYARRLKKGSYNDRTICPPEIKSLRETIVDIKSWPDVDVLYLGYGICVSKLSYLFLLQINDNETKCLICNKVNINQVMDNHAASKEHLEKVINAPIAFIEDDDSFDDEFVRMIQPDLYHCGFCNIVLPFWDQTQLHLKSAKHKFAKKKKCIVCGILHDMSIEPDVAERKRQLASLKNIDSFPFFGSPG